MSASELTGDTLISTTITRKKLANEREDVQKKTFAKWINSQLTKKNVAPITDLFYDLRDGTRLLSLLEILTDQKYKREKGRMRVHHLNNVGRALKILEEEKVKLVNIANDHIVDGSPKLTLGLVWSIILHWQVQGVLKDVMSGLQQTNLEKTLLAWCRQSTQGYKNVDVRNFTTSWRDGLAFCAVIHCHRPELFDWPVMAKKHPYARLNNAFRIGHEHLGIERLLDPEDVNTQNPDKKSLMMYVMCLFQALPHSSISMDSLKMSQTDDSAVAMEATGRQDTERPLSVISVGLGTYQQTLEEVLTWLLGAEDRLAGMPPIADATKNVKDQFHELEDLMMDLTSRQSNIGEVLDEGSSLLRDNLICEEESEEVRIQMKLLSTRWEELRIKAMDRQTKLHEQLMKLQQEELDTLKQWLTKTEDRIANLSELGPTYSELESQTASHRSLQEDLESEQEKINSLSNMVVVVDDSISDAASSSLEDELNALGERWTHICKWAEQKCVVLQNLGVRWFEFDRALKRFRSWLDEKEKLLKEMESQPTVDKEEMMTQALALKALESEMETETLHQNALHDMSSGILNELPVDSKAYQVIPADLEMLQDRWDCLVSILDAQTQRLLSNGIDISKVVVHSVSHSTTISSTREGEKLKGSTPKRQKLYGKSQEDFTWAFVSLGNTMEHIEIRLQPTAAYALSLDQMKNLMEDVEAEVTVLKEDYEKVLNLGKSASSDSPPGGEFKVDNEIKLTSIKSRWAALEKDLGNLRSRIKFNEDMGQLSPQVEQIKVNYLRVEECVNRMQSTTDFNHSVVSTQLQECEENKSLIGASEEELSLLESKSQALPSLWSEEKGEVLRKVQALLFDFKSLHMRISNWEFMLNEKMKSVENPGMITEEMECDFTDRIQELEKFLNEVQEVVQSCPTMTLMPEMQDVLAKLSEIHTRIETEEAKFSSIKDNFGEPKRLFEERINELNTRWNLLLENLKGKISEAENGVELLQQFEEESSGLKSWLGEVENFLEAEEAAIGDVETLQAQLEQSNALQDDIETLGTNMNSIRATGDTILDKGAPDLHEAVARQLKELTDRWENAVTKAQTQNSNLNEALEKSDRVWKQCKDMEIWLEDFKTKIPSLNEIETTSELNSTLESYSELSDQIEIKQMTLEELNVLGKDIMEPDNDRSFTELDQMFAELNDLWNNVATKVNAKFESLKGAKQNYEQFKQCCSEESKWLEELERKIENAKSKSTDAEEISEALYDLDSYLGSHPPALQDAQRLGDLLKEEGMMSVTVQNSLHDLVSKYETLTTKAQEAQMRLEGGVVEAQDLEMEYVKALEELDSIRVILMQEAQEQQLTEMKTQLYYHQEVIQKMERKVEVFRSGGNSQAERRLRDQLNHLLKQTEEIDEKLKLFEQTPDFDEKFINLSQLLTEIDESSRTFGIMSVDLEYLESQLNECMDLYRRMSMVKSEVETVLATGRKIAKEKSGSESDELTVQLDQLKALYNQLGGSVTDLRGRLESGIKESGKVDRDYSVLDEWLTQIEKELDTREASLPIKDIKQEMKFAQHTHDDLHRKKRLLVSIDESLQTLTSLFGSNASADLRDRNEDLSITWERIQTRLANRIAMLKKLQDESSSEITKFIAKLNDIEAWLDKNEKAVGHIEDIPLIQREEILQNISRDVEIHHNVLDEANKFENIEASGIVLETDFSHSQVSHIRRRLENISSLVKKKEKFNESILVNNDDIEAYLAKLSDMVTQISTLSDKGNQSVKYSEAQTYSQEFEQNVCLLEPDVATLISKGDTLTLKTHITDVSKANAICQSVNDLRRRWGELKERVEVLKRESESVILEVREAPQAAENLVKWLDTISKKLDLANNDEKQIKVLENEISCKKNDVDRLKFAGELLKRYQYEELQPMLTLICIRWSEINSHLSKYQKSALSQKSIGEDVVNESEGDLTSVVPDFVAKVNRIREAISCICRMMHSKALDGKKYENLVAKDDALKTIKKEIDRLKPEVDSIEAERLGIVKKSSQSQSNQIRRVVDKLREEWAQVNRAYNESHERWVRSSDTWRSLQKTIEDFCLWLNTNEQKIHSTASQSGREARATQKELEKQVTLKHRPSQTLQTLVKEVTEELPLDDSRRLQDRVEALLRRWRALLFELAKRRERIAQEENTKGVEDVSLREISTWLDKVHLAMEARVNLTDEDELSDHVNKVNDLFSELDSKTKTFHRLKDSKSPDFSASQIKEFETKFKRINKCLPEYKEKVETKLKVVHSLIVDAEELHKWAEDQSVQFALRTSTHEEVRRSRELLMEKNLYYESLDNTYWALSQDAEGKGLHVCENLKSRMNSIESRLKSLELQFSTNHLMTSDHSMTSTDVTMVTSTSSKPLASAVDDEVAKESEDKEKTEAPPVFPSRLSEAPHDTSSPTLILTALDKSILQIRDWLSVMQELSKQQSAVVGDEDSIRKLIEKQKSVLRELESKKPQLDDLVTSADSLKDGGSRSQLQKQVTKLREHWDETNGSVLARKTQLDAMLNDTHKFESKKAELESWLARMESRLERMTPVARTPDIIDQQIREQKAFQAEVHQYKHNFELFSQTTGRLLAVYQNDDTRHLKQISDVLNQRFVSLSSSIVCRGKALYSAMNSTHNLGKALEKFISWLSEAEASVTAIESEADKINGPSSGHGRRSSSGAQNRPQLKLKDLQSEIKSHQDVLASLNATGQKLLGTLENQDEALLLHRRLGEMNHRWNTLKFKSIAIRNRLEGTAENWNSLLLSLRELIEWVIRKDTELSSMGPLIGDIHLLAKSEADLMSFKKGLGEKQPVIESNLKSGRQLIASEPSLSDTSDSEVGRDLDGDSRYRGEENMRELSRAVRREVKKLSEKWTSLWERTTSQAMQASLAHQKLGVLQKTIEEVSSRLGESEDVVSAWGPVSQDQNIAEQQVQNIRKFRENLPDLQRGIDDVNDQAARFSAHNVPLTPNNSAALHDLNNRWKNLETTVNDRWRQLAGRSSEITPLTLAQLATSVSPPWERAAAANKVPYYINHAQETTHWDHPQMMDLLDSLSEYNHIKFSAYRTASKLRSLQKKLSLDRAKLHLVTDVFDEHGLRGQNDRLIDINDMVVVLSTLYGRIANDNPDVDTTLSTDLCLNWLLNVYDSQRTGQMRVLSFRIGLICMCRGQLEEKYRYLFRLIADPNRLVDQRKLGLLLHDCVQVPRQLGEVAAFGGSNIEPSVRSCFTKAGKDRETIEAVHFLTWVQQEPQSLVWLAVLHRVAASETVQHQVKCNICKTYPIVGLRYRCLRCLSFDMCQRCFFEGRSTKSHKITHPMHEYCTATKAGDEMKDFTKALKNKFKSKRSLQKHTKKGYLPVQTVLEGDALESPCPSPAHNVGTTDMHSRLEVYASRLAEVELRTNSNSTPDSEDEHGLIAQYCQSLTSSDTPFPVPKSPLQIMASTDADQKDELEQMIKDLEEENRALQTEYERLKSEQPSTAALDEAMGQRSEAEMLAEAKLLREHKGRLEARMGILEDHNRQLEAQLQRLRQLLMEQTGVNSPNKSSTLQTKSVTASQLATDSPAKINGHNGHANPGDLGKVVGSLVDSMNQETENGSHSDENDYDNVTNEGASSPPSQNSRT